MTTTSTTTEAKRSMANLASLLARVETGRTGATASGTARNIAATAGTAQHHLLVILTGVVALEDAEGVEAAARMSDRATSLRQRMQAAGLISAGDVSRIEAAAIRRADALVNA